MCFKNLSKNKKVCYLKPILAIWATCVEMLPQLSSTQPKPWPTLLLLPLILLNSAQTKPHSTNIQLSPTKLHFIIAQLSKTKPHSTITQLIPNQVPLYYCNTQSKPSPTLQLEVPLQLNMWELPNMCGNAQFLFTEVHVWT